MGKQRREDLPSETPDRRAFLGGIALGAVPFLTAPGLAQPAPVPAPGFPGLITRERQPINLEFPFPTLAGPITPNHRFFVRCHFAVATLDKTTWRLQIDGVSKPTQLTLDDLRKLPARTQTTTLECAGNGRALLTPKSRGLPWEQGAVSTAEWTGVSLWDVLEKTGVPAGAVEVILSGADQGQINGDAVSPGPIHFERSLPLAKAKRPEVLLAYQMNGRDLPVEHGFPVRAVVAGWYGMASVKWLARITVTTTPFLGFFQTFDYSYWKRDAGRPHLVPVQAIQVKAQIARPALAEAVPADTTYRVFGAAWAGEADVTKVTVSADGGKTWQAATLLGKAVPFSWRLWEYSWHTPKEPGRVKLMARATDSQGRTQPESHDRDSRNYRIHFTAPVEVNVVR